MKWPIVVAVFIGGLLAGLYLSTWQKPSNANQCVMSQLGDMRTNDAISSLYYLCEERFGEL